MSINFSPAFGFRYMDEVPNEYKLSEREKKKNRIISNIKKIAAYIPVIGTFLGAYRIGKTIRNLIFKDTYSVCKGAAVRQIARGLLELTSLGLVLLAIPDLIIFGVRLSTERKKLEILLTDVGGDEEGYVEQRTYIHNDVSDTIPLMADDSNFPQPKDISVDLDKVAGAEKRTKKRAKRKKKPIEASVPSRINKRQHYNLHCDSSTKVCFDGPLVDQHVKDRKCDEEINSEIDFLRKQKRKPENFCSKM